MAKKKRQTQQAKKSVQQQEEIARALAIEQQKELDEYLSECAARRLAKRRHIGIPTARVIVAAQKARNTR